MKIGRNDPCHCGSGQKYKKCCLAKDDAAKSAELATAAQVAQAAAKAGDEADEAAGGKPVAAPSRVHDAGATRPKTTAGPQPPPIRRRAV